MPGHFPPPGKGLVKAPTGSTASGHLAPHLMHATCLSSRFVNWVGGVHTHRLSGRGAKAVGAVRRRSKVTISVLLRLRFGPRFSSSDIPPYRSPRSTGLENV